MSLSKKKTALTYQQNIYGTYGRFSTPAGYVNFINTKARLGKSNISLEHRLTGFLSPVREVLPHKDMNFNQLLQRDLDDHRVAVELVPYLLGSKSNPAFFPPIVAALLPFDGGNPLDNFPEPIASDEEDEVASWGAETYGDSFRFERLLDGGGDEHVIKSGRLSWNPEKAKLVVIDGQHRAMALLAVDRTINSKWTGTAEKYKSFYEPVVNRLINSPSLSGYNFEGVEFPVTLVWFPELDGSHQKAARKIFVDLNKNARKPSDSRILLLSDDDLISVFTRTTLNLFREDDVGFPIYAVEYDNPESDQTVGSKWSVITNVSLLSNCIRRLLCGPSKHYKDLSSKFGGKESSIEMAEILRDSLNVISVLEEVVTEDRLYKRSELSHVEFPPSKVPLLEQQYLSGWGALLKELYTNLLPFKSHALALEDLKNGWITSDSAATLAKDSIFEGVGVYWTLRDSENHWREINSDRKGRGELPLPKTDVIDAWAITQAKKADFFAARSKHYLGSERKVAEAEAAYQVFSTAACQLGLVLAIRAIAHRISLPFEGVSDFSVRIVRAINASLKGRLLCLAKDVPENKRRFNLIGKMDSPFAAYFRYFWLEIAATADSVESLVGTGVNGAMLKELALAGRASYRSYLIEEAFKDQKRSTVDTSVSDVQLRGRATEVVDQQLFAGLRSWFGISKSSYEEWKAGLSHVGSAVGDDEAQLEEDSALGEVDEAPDDVDDLISNILKQ